MRRMGVGLKEPRHKEPNKILATGVHNCKKNERSAIVHSCVKGKTCSEIFVSFLLSPFLEDLNKTN